MCVKLTCSTPGPDEICVGMPLSEARFVWSVSAGAAINRESLNQALGPADDGRGIVFDNLKGFND